MHFLEQLKEKYENKDLSIIVTNDKDSILVKNMFSFYNTTVKCKDVFEKLGGEWITKDIWLFKNVIENQEYTLEYSSKFIIKELEKEKYNLTIIYCKNDDD